MPFNQLTHDYQQVSESAKVPEAVTSREYRSTIFTSYFGEAANAAQLYEGVSWLSSLRENEMKENQKIRSDQNESLQKEPIRPEDIVFETLEGVIYLARKNDLAFTVKKKVLVIGEHQSTINRNMPLRSAIYYGRTMEKIVEPKAIYKEKRIAIPTPEFYVFYNGKEHQPLEQTLLLSDSYLDKTNHPMLQLAVKVININLSEAHPILERCRPLYEYSWFVGKVQEYLENGESRDEAIKAAMEISIRQNVMTEFIEKHGSEVRNMLFTEFNLEDAKEVWMEEARKEGADRILVEQIVKKLKRGKNPGVIADELETDLDRIQSICETAESFGPDYDVKKILEVMEE